MIRWTLQRLVRLSPGVARIAWQALPAQARELLSPLVHPIAAGPRRGALPLRVDLPARGARYDVVLADGVVLDPARRGRLQQHGHRVLELGSRPPAELVKSERVFDAVLVVAEGAAEPPVARWGWRVARSVEALDACFPETTIIVPTHAARELCQSCLHSVIRSTGWGRWRVVAVDDGSHDGTAEMLDEIAASEPRVRVVRLAQRRGFAAACNEGLRQASGEYVAFLNDDTVVSAGWLARLVAHMESDSQVGLVCPVTNQIANAARVDIAYSTLEGMEQVARERAVAYAGQRFEVPTVALFCALARRERLVAIGGLDERYEIGMFEDDDLSMTLRGQGATLSVARDAFVHHVGQATLGKLGDREYLAIWEANKRRFERKWGRSWAPPEP